MDNPQERKYEIYELPNGNYIVKRSGVWWLKTYVNLESTKIQDAHQFGTLEEAKECITHSASHHGYNTKLVEAIYYKAGDNAT